MNRPNEELLADWLDGKLEGDDLSKMEAWAAEHAGDLDSEFKCEIGWDALNDDLLESVPKFEEPPYPEFFNSKLKQAILADDLDERANISYVPLTSHSSLWQRIRMVLVPASLAAAVAFYAGMLIKNVKKNENEVIVEVIYVPDENVEVAVSDTLESTEIVLDGLSPMSDDLHMDVSSVSQEERAMTAYHEDEGKVFY